MLPIGDAKLLLKLFQTLQYLHLVTLYIHMLFEKVFLNKNKTFKFKKKKNPPVRLTRGYIYAS
jgi:hypothetical protein